MTTDGFFLNGALFGRQTITPTVTGKGWNPAGDAQSNPVVYGKLLQDASVSANTYGTVIPVSFGARRIVGAVIWAKPLIQSTTSVFTDAKGEWDTIVTINPDGPSGVAGKFYNGDSVSQIIYRTYATFAVAFGRPGASAAQTAYRTKILVGGVSPDDPFASPSGSATSTTTILSSTGSVPSQYISKLWADGTLIYDIEIGWLAGSGSFRLYDGSEDQLPDPVMQADKGIYCPAYRGLIYCVIEALQVDVYGQKVPTITAEILEGRSGEVGTLKQFSGVGDLENTYGLYGLQIDWSSRTLYTTLSSTGSGGTAPKYLTAWSLDAKSIISRNLCVNGGYQSFDICSAFNGFVLTTSFYASGLGYQAELTVRDSVGTVLDARQYPQLNNNVNGDGLMCASHHIAYDTAGNQTIYVWSLFSPVIVAGIFDPVAKALSSSPAIVISSLPEWPTNGWQGAGVANYGGPKVVRGASYRGGCDIFIANYCDDGAIRVWRVTFLPNGVGCQVNIIYLRATSDAPVSMMYDGARNEIMLIYGTSGSQHYADKINAVSGSIRWSAALPSSFTDFSSPCGMIANSPFGNGLYDNLRCDYYAAQASSSHNILTIGNQSGEMRVIQNTSGTYWDWAFIDADNTLYSDYGGDAARGYLQGPVYLPFAGAASGSSGIALQEIIKDASMICGYSPTDIVCENIDDTVVGAILYDASDFRSFLSSVSAGTGFDIVQTPTNLVCKRVVTGPSLVINATIANGDIIDQQANVAGGAGSLGIVQNNRSVTSTAFAGVTLSRASQLEVPYAFQINYIDAQRDYQYSTQSAKRPAFPIRSTESVGISSVQLPLILSGSQAAGYAAKALYRAWSQSVSQSLVLTRKWLVLDPNDVVDLAFIDFDFKGKVTSTTIGADLSIAVTLANLWTDEGLTIPVDTPSLPPPFISTIDYTARAIVIDCPLLFVGDDLAQAALRTYFVLWPTRPVYSWPGGSLYYSTDNVTFTLANGASLKPTIGACLSALPDADPYRFDATSVLNVSFICGDPTALSNITRQAAFSGGNLAAIGAPGRWEIISFTTIAQNSDGSFAITGLVRGLKGSEPMTGTHAVGDDFVLLNGAGLLAASIPLAAYNHTIYLKALGAGQTLSDVTAVSTYTEYGRAEQPLAPAHLTAAVSGSDIHLGWNRRDRLDLGIVAGTGTVPLSEAAEKYDVEILNAAGMSVLRTITDWTPSPTPSQSAVSYTYTNANIVADFGSMLTAGSQLSFNVYQKSAIVGRGFKATATITL
ncbi:phage tail protein [Rhodoblastus sp. 17X3]|uniref:phage tail protein n=1 Tax=Rhodoblastus sp. 17X3 TaxID=3047026 RepID=UPI0024B75416|nr:phage tail protein [Rhodoblastus sp. 17X3]MDI9847379.1 phage tail protein [Rhodoblastus sp. 17X3]